MGCGATKERGGVELEVDEIDGKKKKVVVASNGSGGTAAATAAMSRYAAAAATTDDPDEVSDDDHEPPPAATTAAKRRRKKDDDDDDDEENAADKPTADADMQRLMEQYKNTPAKAHVSTLLATNKHAHSSAAGRAGGDITNGADNSGATLSPFHSPSAGTKINMKKIFGKSDKSDRDELEDEDEEAAKAALQLIAATSTLAASKQLDPRIEAQREAEAELKLQRRGRPSSRELQRRQLEEQQEAERWRMGAAASAGSIAGSAQPSAPHSSQPTGRPYSEMGDEFVDFDTVPTVSQQHAQTAVFLQPHEETHPFQIPDHDPGEQEPSQQPHHQHEQLEGGSGRGQHDSDYDQRPKHRQRFEEGNSPSGGQDLHLPSQTVTTSAQQQTAHEEVGEFDF